MKKLNQIKLQIKYQYINSDSCDYEEVPLINDHNDGYGDAPGCGDGYGDGWGDGYGDG